MYFAPGGTAYTIQSDVLVPSFQVCSPRRVSENETENKLLIVQSSVLRDRKQLL